MKLSRKAQHKLSLSGIRIFRSLFWSSSPKNSKTNELDFTIDKNPKKHTVSKFSFPFFGKRHFGNTPFPRRIELETVCFHDELMWKRCVSKLVFPIFLETFFWKQRFFQFVWRSLFCLVCQTFWTSGARECTFGHGWGFGLFTWIFRVTHADK